MKPKKKITGALGKVLSRHNAVRLYLKNIATHRGRTSHRARHDYIHAEKQNPPPKRLLSGLFNWGQTPEGFTFWLRIEGEYLQELNREDLAKIKGLC